MAEAAASPPPLHRGLPDEISIWEILVRLPLKSLLRCRAVFRAWRCATFTRDFLLAHHARQPSLPLLYVYNCNSIGDIESLDITPFDHRAAAAADRHHPVARIGDVSVRPFMSCDGFVVLLIDKAYLCVVNPATRQFARLPIPISTHEPAGMYLHSPTGEYRILLAPYDPDHSYQVYSLGSSLPPRNIDKEGPCQDLNQ